MPETISSIVRRFRFRFGSPNYNFAEHRWLGRVDKRRKINEPEEHRRQYITDMRWAKALAKTTLDPLFQQGSFALSSGGHSAWKVECDALTSDDWATLARMTHAMGIKFSGVVGVPRGGSPFAKALVPYAEFSTAPILVVDDVLTTGKSIRQIMEQHSESIGLVAFARGPLPEGVRALWAYCGNGEETNNHG